MVQEGNYGDTSRAWWRLKILILGRALLPSLPSLGNLPPDVYRFIEESYRGDERPQGKLIPGAPYSGRRYFALAFSLSRIADVKFYGPGYPDYRESWMPTYNEIDVLDVIKRLYPGDYPDAVISLSPCNPEGLFLSFYNLEKVSCLRALWAADFHNDVCHPGVAAKLAAGTWDLVLKSWDAKGETAYSGLVEEAGVPMEWLPFSIDPEVFRDYALPKTYDVINMGTFAPSHYPLRQAIHSIFVERQLGLSYLCGYDFVTKENPLAGVMTDEYAKIINRGWMYTTCTSSFRYPGIKLMEIMGCNTLLVCDRPIDADELGMVNGQNYVEIGDDIWHYDSEHVGLHLSDPGPGMGSWLDEAKFLELISHYLNDKEELRRIAYNGHLLVHSRHTNEIRAKEFLGILMKNARSTH